MSGHVTLGGIAPWSDGPIVGRDSLVSELVGAAEAAARGNGAVVLLTGEAGIGKTSVARAVAQQVRDALLVTWGTCVADQPPLWPWRALVTPVPSDSRHDAQAIGAPRLEWLMTLQTQVQERANEQPRLHVIEDLQWADVASVLLLRELGNAIGSTPLLVLCTVRTGEPRVPQLDDALEAVRRTATIRALTPLDEHDIALLIRNAASEPDNDLVATVLSRTGGNPLLVSELLRSAPPGQPAQRRRALIAETVPTRVSDVTQHRLGRLPSTVADALVTAAVIGNEGDVATLAAAHHADDVEIVELLDQARAAHLLDSVVGGRWQFRHQLVRDAVYSGATDRVRAQRHAAVLEALAADASTPATALAHHALAALPVFDADRAVALAARAGEYVFARHAYEEAVDWFARALAAAPPDTPPRWRAELLVLSGEAQRYIGDITAARQAFVTAADLTDDPELLARAALGYADPGADLGIAYRSHDSHTGPLLEKALAARSPDDSVVTVQLESRLAAELYFSDRPHHAGELAQSALERARRLGDHRSLGLATAVVHDAYVVGRAGLDEQLRESAQMLEWAVSSGSVAALLTAHRARVFDLLAAGDVSAMDAEIVAFRRVAEPLRAPGYLWWPALWSAMRALLEGRHDIAEQRAIAAFKIGEAPFPTLAFLNMSFLLFFLRREQGRLGEMERGTREFAAASADVPAIRVSLTFMLAELGHIDEAGDSLAAFDEPMLAALHDRNWPASWFQLARAVFVVGDRRLATALLEPRHRPSERVAQVSLATVCLGATDLAAAWLLHTLGDADAADAHYRIAEDVNARIGARCWLAHARADHARLLAERNRAGDGEEAAHLSELATAAAAQIGLATIAVAPATSAEQHPSRFHRDASGWELAFGGRVARVPDSRGLQNIAYLVSRPGEAVSVMELANDEGVVTTAGRGAEAFDERARRQIRDRLHQLDRDEDEAEAAGDGERAALVREQRQQLAEAFARDLGLGGRARRVGDPMERARKTVSTRIRRAITVIERLHPELGRHLGRSIDTGAWCAYRPDRPVDWDF